MSLRLSRVLLVLLFLFFCSVAVSAETMYQVSESELNELEQIQKQQAGRIENLEVSLSERERLLTKKDELLMEQAETIHDLGASFEEYENVVQLTIQAKDKEIKKLQVNNVVWKIVAGVGAAAAIGLGIYIAVQ